MKKKRFFIFLISASAAVYLLCTIVPVDAVTDFKSRDFYVHEKKSGFVMFQVTGTPASGSLFNSHKPVYGLSFGGMVHHEVHGLSFAAIHAYNKRRSGVSFSLLDVCNESSGLAFCLAGGSVRNRGVAAGLWNLAEHNSGMQFGLINQVHPEALIETGSDTPANPEGFGSQVGIFNYSEGKGFQFGLWNTNPNAWIKHFPLINFAF